MRVCLVACVFVSLGVFAAGGCGPKVPQHSGSKLKYPWKKAKEIELDADRKGRSTGELDYAGYQRAKWLYVDVLEDGELNLELEFEPLDDNGSSTVALEVLDPLWNVISEDPDAPVKAAKKKKGEDGDEEEYDDEEGDEEGDDDSSGETQKSRQLTGLSPGRYHVHLFLVGRTDMAEYELNVAFVPVAPEHRSDFPKHVAYSPALPVVPPIDDGPAVAEKKPKGKGKGRGKPKVKEPKEPEEPAGESVKALVISANASGSGTAITINAGTDAGLASGRKGSLAGVKNGGFTLTSCTSRTCKATVKASIDEVNKSSMQVTIK